MSLIKMGLIKTVDIPMRSGHVKLMELTDEGKYKITKEDKKIKLFEGGESLEHLFWKNKVNEYFSRKGFRVAMEEDIGDGKKVDLLASKGDVSLAVEIETGKSDMVGNIEKALDAGLTVLSVATSSDIERKIKDMLSRRPGLDLEKVRVVNAQSATWD